jgi:hypothetical protein
MIVYNADGLPEEKEPVDAHECVARCGYSYEQPETPIVDDDADKKETKK